MLLIVICYTGAMSVIGVLHYRWPLAMLGNLKYWECFLVV